MKRHITLYYILRINTNSSSNLKNVMNRKIVYLDYILFLWYNK